MSQFWRISLLLVFVPLLGLGGSGCTSAPITTLQGEKHPATPHHQVKATLEPRSGNTYAAIVTIHNRSRNILHLHENMFRLEGTPPSQFVPTKRDLLFRPGFQMPASVGPDGVAQGEIRFALRGTPQPVGPVELVVDLPDGTHAFRFEML